MDFRLHNTADSSPAVAIGSIVKNEGPYLLEWVAFHRVIGVDRFFIADNDSDDGTARLLAAMQTIGLVNHIPFPSVSGVPPQLPSYAEIIQRHSGDTDWIAFIDADEFLVLSRRPRSIRSLLKTLGDEIGAVAVNWAIYGSSFRTEPGQGLVIERFTRRAEKDYMSNFHYKSVIRPSAYLGHANPHRIKLKPGFHAVHVNGRSVIDHAERGMGLSSAIWWHPLRINHYVTKSRTEYDQIKFPRGTPTIVNRKHGKGYFAHHDRNEIEDPVPDDLVAATKEAMNDIKVRLREAGCHDSVVELDATITALDLPRNTQSP